MREKHIPWLALVLFLGAAIMVPMAATHAVDFPVYYRATRVFLEGHGPLYGPQSGMGWPMHYRYPPLFLFAFVPFALLPFKFSAVLWAALKWAVLYLLVRAMARQMNFPSTGWWWLVPGCLSASFLVQELKGGNAQFLIFALTAAALLALRRRPWLTAILLALAASLKVWPFFFVPYIAARRRYAVAASTLALICLLTLVPAIHFGWHGNIGLLRQWTSQEWEPGSLSIDMWYPSQSLSGVLQRYLTFMDYSKAVDPNYLDIHVVALPTGAVRVLWACLAVLGYAALLLVAHARPSSDGWIEDSLAWCGVVILEPFTHRISLLALLWPGMVAGTLLARPGALSSWSRRLLYTATVIITLEAIIPGRLVQRLFQVCGVDFGVVCLITTVLVAAWLRNPPQEVAKPAEVPAQSAALPAAAASPP